MRFDLMSDIHLEFERKTDDFSQVLDNLFKMEGERSKVLVVAGDVMPMAHFTKISPKAKRFFKKASSLYEHVIFVLGNHDYWGGIFEVAKSVWQTELGDKITVLTSGKTFDYDGFMFIGDTLWARPKEKFRETVEFSMNDYRYIAKILKGQTPDDEAFSYEGLRLTVLNLADTMNENSKTIKFIRDTLKKNPEKKFVVVTHHAPLMECATETEKPFDLIGAYCNSYLKTIEKFPNIHAWVYGHLHTPKNITVEFGDDDSGEVSHTVQIVSNARGYIHKEAQAETWKLKTIEV